MAAILATQEGEGHRIHADKASHMEMQNIQIQKRREHALFLSICAPYFIFSHGNIDDQDRDKMRCTYEWFDRNHAEGEIDGRKRGVYAYETSIRHERSLEVS